MTTHREKLVQIAREIEPSSDAVADLGDINVGLAQIMAGIEKLERNFQNFSRPDGMAILALQQRLSNAIKRAQLHSAT